MTDATVGNVVDETVGNETNTNTTTALNEFPQLENDASEELKICYEKLLKSIPILDKINREKDSPRPRADSCIDYMLDVEEIFEDIEDFEKLYTKRTQKNQKMLDHLQSFRNQADLARQVFGKEIFEYFNYNVEMCFLHLQDAKIEREFEREEAELYAESEKLENEKNEQNRMSKRRGAISE